MIDSELDTLFEAAHADSKALLPLLQRLETIPQNQFSEDVEARLVALVPQMAATLVSETIDSTGYEDRYVCDALARLGRKAYAAIPSLFEHAQRHPRLEHNVLAIGKIGGPGTVRGLIEWTYWGGRDHDRKRSNAACAAISLMGDEAIRDLLDLACSESEDSHTRSRAILNLYNCTSYPTEKLIPIMVGEIEKPDCYLQCMRVLSRALVRIGQEHPSVVIEHIEKHFFSNWLNFERYVDILSELGNAAVPSLVNALENPDRDAGTREIIAALNKIGDSGLEYLFKTISDSSQSNPFRLPAMLTIPASGRPFFETLVKAIRSAENFDSWFVELAVTRLGDFTDELDQVETFLRTMLCHPEAEIVRAANRSIEQIAKRKCA